MDGSYHSNETSVASLLDIWDTAEWQVGNGLALLQHMAYNVHNASLKE